MVVTMRGVDTDEVIECRDFQERKGSAVSDSYSKALLRGQQY
jgi:hypothetical protein